jgi:sialic acid synthase SpsE
MKKVFIIAELGNTHDGSFGIAKQMIASAARCGADAVKIQTHLFSEESLSSAPNPPYFNDESREEYFTRTSFSKNQYLDLIDFSTECGVEFMSSPFSSKAVEFLESIGIKRYKIPSGEVSNIPMLVDVARTGKPVILSSGMSPWIDIDLAVNTLKKHGAKDISILQCSSTYPCPPNRVGLNIINELSTRYKVDVGYSDHTLGLAAPLSAVSLGVKIIEKHFTLSKLMYGSDAKHSMEPQEFTNMVESIRQIEEIFQNPLNKDNITHDILEMKSVFEKSLVTTKPILSGSIITSDMVSVKKPGTGIPAKFYKEIIGRTALSDINKDCQIQVKDIKGFSIK